MMSLLVAGASACVAAFLFVGSAIADRRQEEMRYARELALAIGGDYRCGYGLNMQAVREAIEQRLFSLPSAALHEFNTALADVAYGTEKRDAASCDARRELAARLGVLDR
jgi:hypothetical protein